MSTPRAPDSQDICRTRREFSSRSFWELETEPAERRKLLLPLFQQEWAKEGRIAAVQPHDAFLPYVQAVDQTEQSRCGKFGAEGGSDGTRTRDLCRDRAAL